MKKLNKFLLYIKHHFRHDLAGFNYSIIKQLTDSEKSILNRVGEWIIIKILYAALGTFLTLYLLSHGSLLAAVIGATLIGLTILILERGSIASSYKEVSKFLKAILFLIAISIALLSSAVFHVWKNGNEICSVVKTQIEKDYEIKIAKLDTKLAASVKAKDKREDILNEEMKTNYGKVSEVKDRMYAEQKALFEKVQLHHDSMIVKLSIQKEAELSKYSSIMNIGFVKALDIFLSFKSTAHYLTSFVLFIMLTGIDIWVIQQISTTLTPDSAYWQKHRGQAKDAKEIDLKLRQTKQKSLHQKQVRQLKEEEMLDEYDTIKMEFKEDTLLQVYKIDKNKAINETQVADILDTSMRAIDSLTLIAKSEKEARNKIEKMGGNLTDYDSIFVTIRQNHIESLKHANTSQAGISKKMSNKAIKKSSKLKRA